ncbi:homeobox protein cup9-related [Anaeramoeba flamelloides]|uniref:Homeobox protein cup9-related n=1 Tax=Anaeramoeba flamelloides TaxID=1746091 RepID=A0ABQ8YE47_9EUKA|nr:homeobox protein cup9-related [Anaeramoeba flamelloides]
MSSLGFQEAIKKEILEKKEFCELVKLLNNLESTILKYSSQPKRAKSSKLSKTNKDLYFQQIINNLLSNMNYKKNTKNKGPILQLSSKAKSQVQLVLEESISKTKNDVNLFNHYYQDVLKEIHNIKTRIKSKNYLEDSFKTLNNQNHILETSRKGKKNQSEKAIVFNKRILDILKKWFNDNIKNPFPSLDEKKKIMEQTGTHKTLFSLNIFEI